MSDQRDMLVLPQPGTATGEPKLSILGIHIHNLSLDSALGSIGALIDQPRPAHVCFVNAHCINIATDDSAYRAAVAGADLVLPDGIGIRLAGRLNGTRVRHDLNGTDLFPHLCSTLASRGVRMYLLGARPGVAEGVSEWITTHHPGIRVCGVQHGYFDQTDEDAVIKAIAHAEPDVLLVALGVPRQELWIKRHAAATGARLSMGVGGLFDFYAGKVPRAPSVMRRLGLEWLYRLYREPRRLSERYIVGNGVFLGRLLRQRAGALLVTRGTHRP